MDRGSVAPEGSSLVALLRTRATYEPDRTAYVFVSDDGAETRLTYAQLDERVRAVASGLAEHAAPGARALLLHSPGADYVTAFFACLYAGLVAVPAYPPSPRQVGRAMPRLRAMVSDCEPVLALCGSALAPMGEQLAAEDNLFAGMRWLPTDQPDHAAAAVWREPAEGHDEPAFLQYTSGSTSLPRGVVLTHGNLLHNLELIRRKFGQSSESVGCSWLPPYHDMGLIGGVLEPVYAGFPMVLMSPASFVRDPARWLRTISAYGVTTSGAPNFAYDLCAAKVSASQLPDVDLSSWQLAFSGAEPVRAATMREFAGAFAPLGFRHEAFYPCYGLAEATLMVTGGTGTGPLVRRFAADELSEGKACAAEAGRELVGCGHGARDQELLVVDPRTRMPLEPGMVGEIWVRGPSIAVGYWQPDEDTFDAALASGENGFLRTGDLGFLLDGELFVTGRLNDMLIVRGRNHYPHDVERTVEVSHDALLPVGAAFTVETDGAERVVCVQEVHRHTEDDKLPAIAELARKAVSTEHGIAVHAVVLVKQATVPRTSSGKVQRHACRAQFLGGSLAVRWHDELGVAAAEPGAQARGLTERLLPLVAAALDLPPSQIDPAAPLGGYGVDSLTAVQIAHTIEEDLGVELSLPDLLGDASIEDLAALVPEDKAPAAPVARTTLKTPMSLAQRRLWFLQQLEPGSPAYHVSGAIRVRGALRHDALRRALDEVVRRHEVLRTALVDGEQVVAPASEIPLEEAEIDATNLRAWLVSFAVRPFDLATPGLLRVALLTTGADEHVLAVAMHHTVTDGWSMGLLLGEIAAGYNGTTLPELPLQYGDFSVWQRETPDLDYWKGALADLTPLALQTDRPRPPHLVRTGADYHFTVPLPLVQALTRLGHEENATLFMVLLAAWQALLARHSGQEDIAVAVPVAGRDRPEFSSLIGCFVNTIVLRVMAKSRFVFRELLREVRTTALRGYAHQGAPFEQVVDVLGVARQLNRMPLADVLFSFRPDVPVVGVLSGLETELLDISTGSTKFDLSLELVDTGDGLRGRIQFSTEMFDEATAVVLAEQYSELLDAVVNSPDAALSRLPLSGAHGSVALPGELAEVSGHVHERFAVHASRTPATPAVVAEDGSLTYGELAVAASDLAGRLNVEVEDRVGLYLGRTTSYIAGLLGVLTAGAAYVPIDPAEPAARVARMVEVAGVRAIVTNADLAPRLAGLPVDIVLIEGEASAPSGSVVNVRPENLAYVVFTSGSTGEPKGVAVEHRQLDSYLGGIEPVLRPCAGDRHAVVSAVTADLCFTTLLLPLVTGGTIDLLPAGEAVDPRALAARMRVVDFLKITPSHLSALLSADVLPRRTLVIGGELLEWRLIERVRELRPDLDIVNHYGPAETTVGVLVGRVPTTEATSVPLTHRIGDSAVYVLDDHLSPVPAGVPGELYVGGPQVSRGYIGRPELTAARFLPDPLTGGRMYRTGDRARVRPDAAIEILGRADRQFKVRGFRVEPGEVEEALRAHAAVDAAVVLASGGDLVGYLVPMQWPGPDDVELREHLRLRLPAHCVPTSFARLAELPVTLNGKLDHAALRTHSIARTKVLAAPDSELEHMVAGIWRTALGVAEVGVEDNFFDVGGHSLLLVEVQRLIKQRLGRDIAVLDLMKNTTVRSQARCLRDGPSTESSAQQAHDRADRRIAARATRKQPSRESTW